MLRQTAQDEDGREVARKRHPAVFF